MMTEKNNIPKNTKKDTKQTIKKLKKNDNKWKAFGVLLLIVFALAVLNQYVLKSDPIIINKISLTELEKRFENSVYKEIEINENKAIATWNETIKIGENNSPIFENSEILDDGQKNEISTNSSETEKKAIVKDQIILPAGNSLNDLGLKNPEIDTQIFVKDNTTRKLWMEIFPTLLTLVFLVFLAWFFITRIAGKAGQAMTFGKSRAKIYDKDSEKVLFSDVAGADEEKVELVEVVDFLKNPEKYKELGAKIPRGILMVGPPGTGKTLLARAVAGESDVPFLSISGSEFVEMFVGVGAARVRDLFTLAKKMAPAIIFIDEIDAIGKKRGPGLGGGHDEREQTLNQILTEMDGFDNDTNVIVMAATNRADVLDKALLRPGRFDRKITVKLPTQQDREEILKVHSKDKNFAEDVDFKQIAGTTVGFSGADLGNLINESAIITARHNEKIISMKRVQEAFERLVMGLRKKSLVMDEQEIKITAYHEVGHALLGKLLPHSDPVHKISIISRGSALGVTWFMPEKDQVLTSKAKFIDELAVLFGGRASEEIFFGKENITTGASNDIERATNIARNMVMRYGMDSEIGLENFAGAAASGNHLGGESERPYFSDLKGQEIDKAVQKLLLDAYETAKKLILENKDLHDKISKDLIEKEEIGREEFEAYFA